MNILWLKNDLLHPVDKGGKIRTYQMLRQLRRRHEVTYVCLTSPRDPPGSRELASEYCQRLLTAPWSEPERFSAGFYFDLARNLFSPLPYVLQKYRSPAMAELIAAELQAGRHDVLVCDFLTPSVNLPRPLPPGLDIASVLFQHNVESVLWRRQLEAASSPARRAYFYAQWRKMRRYEEAECHRHDAVVAVSEGDAEVFRGEMGVRDVFAVPTGVDTEYFAPLGEGERDAVTAFPMGGEPCELVFTGSMDWMPNEDAILYFAAEILPRIVAELPAVRLTVVGRHPTPRLVALAERELRITFTGWVDDVRPYIDRAAVYVVPLRVGGGTRLKIYEAMAMQRAVVSTSIGAEGLPVAAGEELLIANEPAAFAAAVVELVRNPERRARLEVRARQAVCERFGWERATEAFLEACRFAMAQRARRAGTAARVAA